MFSFLAIFVGFILFYCNIQTTYSLSCNDCPQGTSCDSNTGICRQFRPPAGASDLCSGVVCPYGQQCVSDTGRCQVFRDPNVHNRCLYVRCPSGYQCDWNFGICRSFRDPAVKNCTNVLCPQGTMCDSNSGVCRQFRPPAIFRRLANRCAYSRCPNGYICNIDNGICQPEPAPTSTGENSNASIERNIISSPSYHSPTRQSCPVNSKYIECGTRCPYTCTELHPRCNTNEHNCIGTCQCMDGYVQASAANVTCVPARSCPDIAKQVCAGLRCSPDMICVDGYCNPVNCPPILKPHLDHGCEYNLVRDTRNCVILKSSCN
uniref:TIL domain-containing protein n=1 Tax=Panagrellus redivivus TaxID=6233 RepID=A0A7E4VQV0_PANRE